MKKYIVQRERKRIPIVLFVIALIATLIVEIHYFELLYNKRSEYLNIPDYKPMSLNVSGELKFIGGNFPVAANFDGIDLFIFKNFSINLQKNSILKIYSEVPYHLIFSNNFNKYEFFGKILYLRSKDGIN